MQNYNFAKANQQESVNDTFYPSNDTSAMPLKSKSLLDIKKRVALPRISLPAKEFLYQLVISFVLMIFFSFELTEDKKQSLQTLFAPSKISFFANYLVAAMVINYLLLPKLYYRKRTLQFMLCLAVLIVAVIIVDELVLEQIFFPYTRGTHFPGVLFTLVETLPIIIVMVAFKLAWDSNVRQSELDRLKALMNETEIEFLKQQINPHFLFNNLNNLYAYALDNSPKTPAIILELSAVLRYMLYGCKTDFVALASDIQHLENYVKLNQLQLENRGTIKFSQELANAGFLIPPLILIVFVENAFKHSTQSLTNKINISIALNISQNGQLLFSCQNNYDRNHQPNSNAKGIGLVNVKKRLDLQYAGLHQLDISDDGYTFNVRLSMHLKKPEQQ